MILTFARSDFVFLTMFERYFFFVVIEFEYLTKFHSPEFLGETGFESYGSLLLLSGELEIILRPSGCKE